MNKNNSIEINDLIKKNDVNIDDKVYQYILSIKQFINKNFPEIHVSTRCLKQIVSLSRSLVILNEKDYVTYQDIKDIIPYILKHRINIVEKNKVLNFVNEEIINKIDLPDDQ